MKTSFSVPSWCNVRTTVLIWILVACVSLGGPSSSSSSSSSSAFVAADCLADSALNADFLALDTTPNDSIPREGSCCQSDVCGIPCAEPVSTPTVGTYPKEKVLFQVRWSAITLVCVFVCLCVGTCCVQTFCFLNTSSHCLNVILIFWFFVVVVEHRLWSCGGICHWFVVFDWCSDVLFSARRSRKLLCGRQVVASLDCCHDLGSTIRRFQ